MSELGKVVMMATSRMSEKLRAGGAGADARAGQLTCPGVSAVITRAASPVGRCRR